MFFLLAPAVVVVVVDVVVVVVDVIVEIVWSPPGSRMEHILSIEIFGKS